MSARLRRHLHVQQSLTGILGAPTAVSHGAPRFLRVLCEAFGWAAGEVWVVDPPAEACRRGAFWHGTAADARAYEVACRAASFAPGVGLPGRVWAAGRPVWTPDASSIGCPCASAAAKGGLRSAFGVPVRVGREALAVLLLLGSGTEAPDGLLRATLGAAARQLGQALARERAEDRARQAERMAALGRLAAEAAHDLNNLLTAVAGHGELVLGGLRPDDPARESAAEVVRACDLGAALTRRLLAFCRKQAPSPSVLDLGAVVAGLEALLRTLAGKGVELVMSVAPAPQPVRAEPGQLEQVLLNLAANARDAMPGGGTLTIATAGADLAGADARARPGARPGPCAVLEVTDTGCGMGAETQARLAEPFFTTKGPGGGTGLGLSIVYGIVRQAGGHVVVDSEVGRGTTFRISWPRAQGPPPPGTDPPAKAR